MRGQRWHGRSQKWQRPGDRTLLEEAEAQLLRLYLHLADYRSSIREALEERDLDFSMAHHRLLWQQILLLAGEPEQDGALEKGKAAAKIDLMEQLQDCCADFPDRLSLLYAFFQLDEKTKRDLLRAPLVIRAATACMERVMCEKRCRHFLSLWEKMDSVASPELAHYYQQQIYAEKQRIAELDQQQRQTTFVDLAQVPWVGEFYEALETPQAEPNLQG